MHRQWLLAPLTLIIQAPKQQPMSLAESFWGIFSATVVVETAEKRGQKWKRCDFSFFLLKKTQRARAVETDKEEEEGSADRGSFINNKMISDRKS